MSNTNTGGPAFPTNRINMHGEVVPDEEGMTLRDYFAAKAMQAHIGRDDVFEAIAQEKFTPNNICSACYAWADAMLKARDQ